MTFINRIKRWLKKMLGLSPDLWTALEKKTTAPRQPSSHEEDLWDILDEKLEKRKNDKKSKDNPK